MNSAPVNRQQIELEIERLAHEVGCDTQEVLRRLDARELDDLAVSSQLRMWRFLLDSLDEKKPRDPVREAGLVPWREKR